MGKIELDLNWAKSVMKNSPVKNEENEDKKYNWVTMSGAGTYKFRILPPNMKSPGKFGMIVGTHFGLGKDGKGSCRCVETTYPECEGIVCPVCEAIRRMERDGISDAKKYEPTIHGYMKTLMLETPDGPCKEKDKITLFKTKTNYNLNWVINEYMSPDSSDFLSPTNGAVVKFSRDKKDGKWERKVLDTGATGGGLLSEDEEIQKKLLADNEDIDLGEIFKRPNDEDMMKIKGYADELENSLREAASIHQETVDEMTKTATSSNEDLDYKTAEEVNNTSTVGTVVPEDSGKEVDQEVENKIKSLKPSSADNCFGDDKQYDPDSTKCMKCPYSFECASAIRDYRGINVKMA